MSRKGEHDGVVQPINTPSGHDSTNSSGSRNHHAEEKIASSSGFSRPSPSHRRRDDPVHTLSPLLTAGPSPARPRLGSRQSSTISINQISQMVSDDRIDTDTYGMSELRDGFFDAISLEPAPLQVEELLAYARTTLPVEFDKASPLNLIHFVPRQWHEMKSLIRRVLTTRVGLNLLRSFVAFFVAYVLCLIDPVRLWLGRYHYMMVLSVIINHPARSIGSQIDGAVLTLLGTATGLGWGVVGLLLSTSTLAASAGYGGILALFLVIFMAGTALIRSFFIRFYQAVICAGVAVVFTTLAEANERDIEWPKLRGFGVAWLIGQAIALVVNCLVFPNAGTRSLASTLHQTFGVMTEAVTLPFPTERRLRRRLARAFVDMSEAHRDLTMDLSVSRFHPDDIHELRNLIQAVVRKFLSLSAHSGLFSEDVDADEAIVQVTQTFSEQYRGLAQEPKELKQKVKDGLVLQTKELIWGMNEGLQRCDAALMNISGYRKDNGPPQETLSDLSPILIRLSKAKAAFDIAETTLLESEQLPKLSFVESDIVKIFVLARHIRESVPPVENLLSKVSVMQNVSDWPRVYFPSYPFMKSIYRTNAQVRHDRGGLVAGSYQTTFAGIAQLLDKIKSREHIPTPYPEMDYVQPPATDAAFMDALSKPATNMDKGSPEQKKLGYKMWRVLYRLQGFESRHALKACLVTSLLSVPSYLSKNREWWNHYEVWWAVAMSWIVMHPRIGGNLQDLVVRACAAIFGAVWSGAAYAAGQGNPFVMAVFAAIYMLPMLYRFTQSSHPRSGLVGCISFTVISLSLHANNGGDGSVSPTVLASNKGLVFLVGTTVPIVVNWILWPFVARHELRDALSSMLFFMSVIYRNVVAKYVYFEEGKEPTDEDVQRSEVLEGRVREGFVRIRQLLQMTRHELRLRAPFDPLPSSALADACERFFEHLVAARQSALFHDADRVRNSASSSSPTAAKRLLTYRRDAVAAVLANLYVLAGALRSQRKVPRYLPSAVAARKKLLVKAAEMEEEEAQQQAAMSTESGVHSSDHRKWHDIYSYSYNESLTGCVAQLEEMERYTKLIVGQD